MGKYIQAIALVAACSMMACSQPVTHSPEILPHELAQEEMRQQQLVDEAAKKGGVPRSWRTRKNMNKEFQQVAERIEESGAELCQEMGIPQLKRRCYYYFEKTRSREINAYTDGEYIYVNRGMLRFTGNEEELAFIMSHELAHALMAHVDTLSNDALAGGALGLLLDGLAYSQGMDSSGEFTQLGADLGGLSYSIDYEKEADYVGLYIMSRAGYDATLAPQFWQRMTLENPKGIYQRDTHPSNAERYVAMQKTISEIHTKQQAGLPLLPAMKQ